MAPFQALEAAFHGAGQIARIYQQADAPRVEFEASRVKNQITLSMDRFWRDAEKLPYDQIGEAWGKQKADIVTIMGKQPREIQYALAPAWDFQSTQFQSRLEGMIGQKRRSEEVFSLQREIQELSTLSIEESEPAIRSIVEGAHAVGLIDTQTAFEMGDNAIGQINYSEAKRQALSIAHGEGWGEANAFAMYGTQRLDKKRRDALLDELATYQRHETKFLRENWHVLSDELRTMGLNGVLTEEIITHMEMTDPRGRRFDGDPGDVYAYARSFLKNGISTAEDLESKAWDTILFEIHSDPTLSDEMARRKIAESGAPTDVKRRWDTRTRNPSNRILIAQDGLDRAGKSVIDAAIKSGKNVADALYRVQQVNQLFIEGISSANRSNMTQQEWDETVNRMGGNLSEYLLQGSISDSLDDLIIRPSSVREGKNKGLFSTTDAFKLQNAVQNGKTAGMHELLRPQLNQLANAYENAAWQQIGTKPMTYISPSGQPFMQYIIPTGVMGKYGAAVLDDEGNPTDEDFVAITYMVDGNELRLKSWDAGLRQWVDLTDNFQTLAKNAGIWTNEGKAADPPDPNAFRNMGDEWSQRNPGYIGSFPADRTDSTPSSGPIYATSVDAVSLRSAQARLNAPTNTELSLSDRDRVAEKIKSINIPTGNRSINSTRRGTILVEIARELGVDPHLVREVYDELQK